MRIIATAIFSAILILTAIPIISRDYNLQLIELENVSRFSEDRIAFQHIELSDRQFAEMPNMDSSVATLLIIKDRKMYLMKDGYDNLNDINLQKSILEIEDKLVGDLSLNKISSKPNYIRITERRIEVLRKIDAKDGEDFVSRNFNKFYLNVRNTFLAKHISIFRELMIGRGESGLYVEKARLPRRLILGGGEEPFKFATRVYAKSDDEKIYFAEDADGDGITETFSVHLGDGFHWGYKSGPNIIFIFNNKQEDIKNLIGNLTKEALAGTPEEEQVLKSDMDQQFRKSMLSKSVQGKTWDDTENIQSWISEIIYESNLNKNKK